MDRDDERKETSDAEVPSSGILGLGGSAVPKMPGDPSASNDPESVAHRRERVREDDETLNPRRDDPYKRSSGATGIDMGAGGRGTDVNEE